jgi:hypothetical protein
LKFHVKAAALQGAREGAVLVPTVSVGDSVAELPLKTEVHLAIAK